jgi:hypothetical protein
LKQNHTNEQANTMTTIRVIASTILFTAFGLAQAPSQAVPTETGAISLRSAPLARVIAGLARQLQINYVLDPSVATNVLISTYGDSYGANARDVLDLILQSTGATTVEVDGGAAIRIVPQDSTVSGRDHISLNLVFLEGMRPDQFSQFVLQFSGKEPVEVIGNVSSHLLMFWSRSKSVN